jgi:cyclopropane fatty-acyl-phospholipid synthase-like methyltransferase
MLFCSRITGERLSARRDNGTLSAGRFGRWAGAQEAIPDGGFWVDAAKRYAPATLRNREPIRRVLQEVLPKPGVVLEIGSGSGEHAVFFAAAFPQVTWQPSDGDRECCSSIAAWAAEARLANLRPPRHLDIRADPPAVVAARAFDAIVCINMIHIAPWNACVGLMACAARALRDDGILYLYGPFMRGGRHTAPSNAGFDESLKAIDPRFGVRDLADVSEEAGRNGLVLDRQVEMPSNNLSLVFRRADSRRTA